jgi:thiazole synthase/sulfur carrier protein
MNITVNGAPRDVPAGVSVMQLLQLAGQNLNATVVERNGEIVDRKDFAQTHLEEGDSLELVRFVGGG